MTPLSILIVGAGLTGLVAAQKLHAAGLRVIVLDKGSSVGGRMATRKLGSGVCDHGAQFFTVRDPAFKEIVKDWLSAGAAREWCRGFLTENGQPTTDGHPRYSGFPGMRAIAELLAKDLDVRCGSRVTAASQNASGWQVHLETGELLEAGSLILTPPIPQALDLLDTGSVVLPPRLRLALQTVEYEPCLSVMVLLDGPSRIPAPGAVQTGTEPLSWIADNQQKGISPQGITVTLHGGVGFSRAYWDAGDSEVAHVLIDAAAEWLGGAKTIQIAVERWRYSRPGGIFSTPTVMALQEPPLLLAGDAFGGPRLEGAALSGLAAAELVLKLVG